MPRLGLISRCTAKRLSGEAATASCGAMACSRLYAARVPRPNFASRQASRLSGRMSATLSGQPPSATITLAADCEPPYHLWRWSRPLERPSQPASQLHAAISAEAEKKSMTAHPYYPLDASLPGYEANATSLPAVLALFGGITGAVVYLAYSAARRQPALRGVDCFAAAWFALCM